MNVVSLADDTCLPGDSVDVGSQFFVSVHEKIIEFARNVHMKRWIYVINLFFQILQAAV